jgi:crossover junction endodeoxyribonuclease RuvC
VISAEGARLRWIAHGVVTPPESAPFSERLLHLLDAVTAVCGEYGCEEAAIEEVFVNMNPSSTLKLGHARAAVMLAPARCGLPVAEYSPSLIKKAVVGGGHADKTQIAFMVKRLLPASGDAKADAADALAVALTHAQLRKRALLIPPPTGEGDRVAVEGSFSPHRTRFDAPPSRRASASRHLPQRGRNA